MGSLAVHGFSEGWHENRCFKELKMSPCGKQIKKINLDTDVSSMV